LVGKPSIVGADENLTIDEIIKLNDALPQNTTLFTNCGRRDIFSMVIRAGASDYIDYENAKCNFTDSSFIDMMEFVKTLPENIGNGMYHADIVVPEALEKIRNDNSYLLEFSFYEVASFINLKNIYGEEDYVIKGYPNQTGNGSVIVNADFFAINNKSPNKAGAWEFIKFYLSDEVQLYQSTLPITNSALSYIIDDYLSKYFYTVKGNITWIEIHDTPIEPEQRAFYDDFSFTEADAVEIKRFLNELSVVPKYDDTVLEIIFEEVLAFFADAITSEQCAKYIQNRVSTYLNERK
jgi:ABC-type glycerol-3-phosphate transport system substrate-binding protein